MEKAILMDALSRIQSICGRKTNNVITTSVLMTAESDYIRIVATDYETSFRGIYPATVEKEGVVAINGKKTFEIVKELPASRVCIEEVENYWIQITESRTQDTESSIFYHLVGMNPHEFPSLTYLEETEPAFRVASSVLKKALENALMIPVGEEKKPHTTGILIEPISEEETQPFLRLLSTDINRLVKVDIPCEIIQPDVFTKGVIASKKGLADVTRILAEEEWVEVGIRESKILFRQKEESISVSLMEGIFPPFMTYVQKMGKQAIQIDKEIFLAIMRRMSILVSEQFKGVVISLGDHEMTVTSTNPDLGESREQTPIDYSGEPISIAINPRYVIDALSMINGPDIVFRFGEGRQPCIVEDKDNTRIQNIIMPMRI